MCQPETFTPYRHINYRDTSAYGYWPVSCGDQLRRVNNCKEFDREPRLNDPVTTWVAAMDGASGQIVPKSTFLKDIDITNIFISYLKHSCLDIVIDSRQMNTILGKIKGKNFYYRNGSSVNISF